MTLEERLNEQIDKLEDEKYGLEKKLEQKEAELDLISRAWELHKYSENVFDLPYPRIEMRFEKNCDTWYSHKWTSYLVYRHYGAYDDTQELIYIPISQTTGNGGGFKIEEHVRNGKIDTPFRDSMNIPALARVMDLPCYVTCLEAGVWNRLEYQGEPENLKRMINLV